MNKGDCKICEHPEVDQIHELLLNGTPITHIPAMFSYEFTRMTLTRHIRTCLKTSHYQLTIQQKINNAVDADNRYQILANQSLEALEASREVLLVNGQLNFHPRSWEIKVVYKHPFIKDAKGEPAILTDTLENVLAFLSDNGIETKSTILKMEDIRKTHREQVRLYKELIENYLRIFGAFKESKNTKLDEQLQFVRSSIQHAATKTNKPYNEMLCYFIEVYSNQVKPEILKILEQELAVSNINSTHPLPPAYLQKDC